MIRRKFSDRVKISEAVGKDERSAGWRILGAKPGGSTTTTTTAAGKDLRRQSVKTFGSRRKLSANQETAVLGTREALILDQLASRLSHLRTDLSVERESARICANGNAVPLDIVTQTRSPLGGSSDVKDSWAPLCVSHGCLSRRPKGDC